MNEPEMAYEVLVERVASAAKTIGGIAESYMGVAKEDTSPDERRNLAEVVALLDQALDRLA